jgi:hypothetical protein
MSQGDYNFYQRRYASKNLSRAIVIADDTTALNNIITPKSADHQLYIQKVMFRETVESNGKSLTFQDDASTAVLLGVYSSVTAAAGIPKSLELDYGPEGFALTKGKNLDVIVSAAGIAGSLHIEAYEKLVGPVAQASTN